MTQSEPPTHWRPNGSLRSPTFNHNNDDDDQDEANIYANDYNSDDDEATWNIYVEKKH